MGANNHTSRLRVTGPVLAAAMALSGCWWSDEDSGTAGNSAEDSQPAGAAAAQEATVADPKEVHCKDIEADACTDILAKKLAELEKVNSELIAQNSGFEGCKATNTDLQAQIEKLKTDFQGCTITEIPETALPPSEILEPDPKGLCSELFQHWKDTAKTYGEDKAHGYRASNVFENNRDSFGRNANVWTGPVNLDAEGVIRLEGQKPICDIAGPPPEKKPPHTPGTPTDDVENPPDEPEEFYCEKDGILTPKPEGGACPGGGGVPVKPKEQISTGCNGNRDCTGGDRGNTGRGEGGQTEGGNETPSPSGGAGADRATGISHTGGETVLWVGGKPVALIPAGPGLSL